MREIWAGMTKMCSVFSFGCTRAQLFSPSPLNCGAGGGACPVPSTGRDRPCFTAALAAAFRRRAAAVSGTAGGERRSARCRAARSGAERSAGGSRSGVPAAAKRRFWNLRGIGSMFGKFPGWPWSVLARRTLSASQRRGTGARFGP